MKTIITITMMLFLTLGYAQQEQPACTKGRQAMTPHKQFKQDLEKNTLKVYALGGLRRPDHDADTAFIKKYGIAYHDFGCLAPVNMEYFNAYNRLVFQYLKDKHGVEWEKDIRTSAMGLHNWKELK